jgi:isoamylase
MNANGKEMEDGHWKDANVRCFGMLLDGRAQVTGIRRRGEDATLLLVFNAWHDVVKFTLPEANGGKSWQLLIDTNMNDAGPGGRFDIGHSYEVTARSLLLFELHH